MLEGLPGKCDPPSKWITGTHQMENSRYSARIAALAEVEGHPQPCIFPVRSRGSVRLEKFKNLTLGQSQTPDGVVHPIEGLRRSLRIDYAFCCSWLHRLITVKRGTPSYAESHLRLKMDLRARMGYLGVRPIFPWKLTSYERWRRFSGNAEAAHEKAAKPR